MISKLDKFIDDMRGCNKCLNECIARYMGEGVSYKLEDPYVELDVYRKYLPERVKYLFIAEPLSFRWRSSFYDESIDDYLRHLLLNEYLVDFKLRNVNDFKEKGMFLTNVAKCRLYMPEIGEKERRSIVRCMSYMCRDFLYRELEIIAERGLEGIVIFGNLALESLRAKYRNLPRSSLKIGIYEIEVAGKKIKTLVMPHPASHQFKKYYIEMYVILRDFLMKGRLPESIVD